MADYTTGGKFADRSFITREMRVNRQNESTSTEEERDVRLQQAEDSLRINRWGQAKEPAAYPTIFPKFTKLKPEQIWSTLSNIWR